VLGRHGSARRLLERHRPSLYAAAVALLRDREEALDAVQETFVVALVRIGSLRDPRRSADGYVWCCATPA